MTRKDREVSFYYYLQASYSARNWEHVRRSIQTVDKSTCPSTKGLAEDKNAPVWLGAIVSVDWRQGPRHGDLSRLPHGHHVNSLLHLHSTRFAVHTAHTNQVICIGVGLGREICPKGTQKMRKVNSCLTAHTLLSPPFIIIQTPNATENCT